MLFTEKIKNRKYLVLCLLMLINAGMLAYSATLHSPTLNEPGHLVAGLSNWKFGRFELYRVNPPLTRMIAAIPVMWVGYEEDWSGFYDAPGGRPVFGMGADFIKANGERSLWLFTLARWACIPISLLGCWFVFRFAEELYGTLAGLTAALLWCFSPNILAHAEWITPDCAGTTFGIAATYFFWKWLKSPGWAAAGWAGLFLGLAELSKATWILLFGLWPVLWIFWLISERLAQKNQESTGVTLHSRALTQLPQLGLILLIGLYLLNLGYGFEGSFTRLGTFQFVSTAFTGQEKPGEVGNRFQGTLLKNLPVPLPANYIRGIDIQKKDFESYHQPNYLRGEWREHSGWWYYYLYALAVKGALGTWLLFMISLCSRAFRLDPLIRWRDETILLAPALVVLVLVSSQDEINAHLRYILPTIGLFIIFSCRAILLLTVQFSRRKMNLFTKSLLTGCLFWTVSTTIWHYPHQLAYFNELVGGPKNGYKHLLGSNLDWGQDLLFAREWMKQNNITSNEVQLVTYGVTAKYGAFYLGLNGNEESDCKWIIASPLRVLLPTDSANYEESINYENIGYTFWVFSVNNKIIR